MMAALQLPPSVAPLVDSLARVPSVSRVLLFGSRARGTAGDRADVDLAVEAPGASAADWRAVREAVETARTLYTVDLVQLDEAPPPLREEVIREGVALYERR